MKLIAKSFFCLAVALIAISCGGNDTPNPTATTCKILQLTTSDNNTKSTATFKYAANRVSEILTTSTFSGREEKTTMTLTYDATGRLSSRKSLESNRTRDYTYIYKANGELEKVQVVITSTNNTTPEKYELRFEYVNGKISKLTDTYTTKEYTYNAQGNIATLKMYYNGGNTQLFSYAYDNKVNFYTLLKGLIPESPEYSNLNNVTLSSTQINGSKYDITYSYTYNAKNLPTKSVASAPNNTSLVSEISYLDCN
jgi:YD repeat-containing protein